MLKKKNMRKTVTKRVAVVPQRHRFTSNLLANLIFQITGVMVINIDKYALSYTLYTLYTLCTAKTHLLYTPKAHLTQRHFKFTG